MSAHDNGGPAFPITGTHEQVLEIGVTLRDYFAAKAMAAYLVASPEYRPPVESFAIAAYQMADAMLKARSE